MEVFERYTHMGIRDSFYRVRVFKVGTEQSVGRSLWADPNQVWSTPCIYPALSSVYSLCIIDIISFVISFILTA